MNVLWVGTSAATVSPAVTLSSEFGSPLTNTYSPASGETATRVCLTILVALKPSVTPQTIQIGGAGTLPSSGSSVVVEVMGSN